MNLIKLGIKLSKVPGLNKILVWYGRKCFKDGMFTADDFINIAVIGQIERLERASDEELEELLNRLRNRTPEEMKTAGEYFPSPQAIDKFCEEIISEIERILFLREHRRRHKLTNSKE